MTLLGYFWDRWQYFAGKLSWDVTTAQVNSALQPFGVAKSSTSFGWGKGGKVTSAGWQVKLCDLIWHVIFRSSVVISITNCYIRVYFTLSLLTVISSSALSFVACRPSSSSDSSNCFLRRNLAIFSCLCRPCCSKSLVCDLHMLTSLPINQSINQSTQNL